MFTLGSELVKTFKDPGQEAVFLQYGILQYVTRYCYIDQAMVLGISLLRFINLFSPGPEFHGHLLLYSPLDHFPLPLWMTIPLVVTAKSLLNLKSFQQRCNSFTTHTKDQEDDEEINDEDGEDFVVVKYMCVTHA